MNNIIIISEDTEGTGYYEWKEVYNGDIHTEAEAKQLYADEWGSELEDLQAHTVSIKDLA